MNASSYTYHLKEDLDISKIIVATHNTGKWGEFEYYLRTWPCSVQQGDFLAEPEETGKTFIENAILKARAAAEVSNAWCLGDDAGIQIQCLDNFPSVHTKRFAQEHGGWQSATKVLLDRIQAKKGKDTAMLDTITATYHCALALSGPTGEIFTAEGIAKGRIAQGPLLQICEDQELHKSPSIAFEPIFFLEEHLTTYTMMEPLQRLQYHYRYRAVQLLQQQIFVRKNLL
jgi:non-canonical purine NTP pyrophosphatase (RdgB/HAM1 family)